jgi:CheY-like chemotaxis protein
VSEKRALIVDDSKSARVVLSRMLQKYDLAVDTSDSAEQALEYLKAHRPDVIFMDHLMPGMDGLAAVQAIRSNPDTSTIPIMMYTSQEGELYLGQARALGATGVLPKRIGSSEVSRILQDLQLVAAPEGDGGATGAHSGPIVVPGPVAAEATATPSAAAPDAPAVVVAGPGGGAVGADAAGTGAPAPAVHVVPLADLPRVLEPLLKQHAADLRRFVVASLDGFAARVVAETREPAPPAAAAPEPVPAPVVAPAAPVVEPPRPTGWIAFAVAASLAALAAGGFAAYQQRQIDALTASVARLATAPRAALPEPAVRRAAEAPAAAVPAAAGTAAGADGAAATTTAATAGGEATPPPAIAPLAFPYGALPFADARLTGLAATLADLERAGAQGVLTATLHSGEFCLTGNPAEGYVLAPDEMPADRCDVVGNPHYDGLRTAQRQGAGYADLVAALRSRTAGALDVRVVDAGRQGAVAAYPSGGGASAQQWNAAAATNQRIEFQFAPADRAVSVR